MPRRNKSQPHHQGFKQKSNCTSKRRYISEKQAKDAADTQSLVEFDLELSVYLCPDCNGWHLTRKVSDKN